MRYFSSQPLISDQLSNPPLNSSSSSNATAPLLSYHKCLARLFILLDSLAFPVSNHFHEECRNLSNLPAIVVAG